MGAADNIVSTIAQTADTYLRINNYIGQGSEPDYYDSELVERFRQLKPQIDGAKNNLVVFHLMGNHQDWCHRFPAEFARFGSREIAAPKNYLHPITELFSSVHGGGKNVDCYDNSLIFTDYVLSRIYAEATALDGFRALVYVPDHAEDVSGGAAHDPQRFKFAMTRIPLLVWLSDAFMVAEPKRVGALRAHVDSVWTNDLLDDLMLGLMGIEQPDSDPRVDLSSSSYNLDWSTALTMHGRRRVRDDPDHEAESKGLEVKSAGCTKLVTPAGQPANMLCE